MSHAAWINFRDRKWDAERWKVSAWLRANSPEILTSSVLDLAMASRRPGVITRAKRLLDSIQSEVSIGESIALWPAHYVLECDARAISDRALKWMAVSWCRSEQELEHLLQEVLVGELGWVTFKHGDIGISGKGLIELEVPGESGSRNAFCAMWFADDLLSFFGSVMKDAIHATGYDALRLDHKEHNNPIDDEIIASIRGARFVVADFTGHRGGVYYEAGFAQGLGIPVIFMVRDDQQEGLHFDVQQQNFIVWCLDDLPEARRRLENRIRATIGQGPLDPNRS